MGLWINMLFLNYSITFMTGLICCSWTITFMTGFSVWIKPVIWVSAASDLSMNDTILGNCAWFYKEHSSAFTVIVLSQGSWNLVKLVKTTCVYIRNRNQLQEEWLQLYFTFCSVGISEFIEVQYHVSYSCGVLHGIVYILRPVRVTCIRWRYNYVPNHHCIFFFFSVYSVEATLKIIGLGFSEYFHSGWNIYDFIVTVLAVIGIIAERFASPFFFIVILRPLR